MSNKLRTARTMTSQRMTEEASPQSTSPVQTTPPGPQTVARAAPGRRALCWRAHDRQVRPCACKCQTPYSTQSAGAAGRADRAPRHSNSITVRAVKVSCSSHSDTRTHQDLALFPRHRTRSAHLDRRHERPRSRLRQPREHGRRGWCVSQECGGQDEEWLAVEGRRMTGHLQEGQHGHEDRAQGRTGSSDGERA